jgi:hypothetical protein
MSMPKRLDPGAKQGIMTKTHRQTLDGKKHPSFATQSLEKQTSLRMVLMSAMCQHTTLGVSRPCD